MSTPAGWEVVIGLEMHVQLRTSTKMFCRCLNRYGDRPNANVCPVCLAHPGMLPQPNAEAIRQAIRVGLAVGCRIPEHSKFDRKNYFYPDSPKAYQISQYDEPLCADGSFAVPGVDGFTVRLVRAHLEEDAAKTVHHGAVDGRITGSLASVVDFNRAGTPLLEIVTEPDLRSAEQARRFLTWLRATVIGTGASDGDMEKGSLRCDANVSVRREGAAEYGTKCELKNMNSFRFLERGINAEVARQIALLEAGEPVRQATFHFDPTRDELRLLRLKEDADDYRYFPEPDLVPMVTSPEVLYELRATLPEAPAARMERLLVTYGIKEQHAEALALDGPLGDYFEALAAAAGDARTAANWTMGEVSAHLNAGGLSPAETPAAPERVATLIGLIADGTLSSSSAKALFTAIVARPDADPAALVDELGLRQVADGDTLDAIIDGVLAAHPAEVDAYRAGKVALIGFFTGQAMKASGGTADPKALQAALRARLS